MPKPPSPPELFCAALYKLTGGELIGLRVATMARELGITFESAEALAADCAKRGWLEQVSDTVALRAPGFDVARKALEATSTPDPSPAPSRHRRRPT